jgi:tetratricopeptide (TPR) repeat protein
MFSGSVPDLPLLVVLSLVILSLGRLVLPAQGQSIPSVQSIQPAPSIPSTIDEPAPTTPSASSLGLTPAKASQLGTAVATHDYTAAEKLLLDEIQLDPHSLRAAHLLDFAGNIYFLNRDYLNAAIAWKKSEAIIPLDPPLRFSLAMAYIRMGHPDWARTVLVSLAAQQPKEALYPYWLGRLDYDAHQYENAIRHFQQAVALAPKMARAYDNLGLCYYYRNENSQAIDNYKKAIELDRGSEHRSPWPYLNLSVTLEFLNQLNEAEADLREALRIDPQLALAHYRLGSVLEELDRQDAAVDELRESARLDDHYAEPHLALARIYKKLGNATAAQEEVKTYLRLRTNSNTGSATPAPSSPPPVSSNP